MRRITAYQQWIKLNFLGNDVKNSIELKVDSLLSEAKQFTLPIKLSAIAKVMGIDPKPLYLDQPYDGSLILKEGRLRIALTLNYREHNRYSQRLRFTYAHELIHCLSYDLNNFPNQRIAPLPDGLEEEHLCNYGAAKLILPKKVLSDYFKNNQNVVNSSNAEKINLIANKADCSINTVVIELITSGFLKKDDSLYILSLKTSGYQNKGALKPRCLVGVYFRNGLKHDFIASNKGLEHIKTKENHLWSLLRFHNDYTRDYMDVKDEIITRSTDGKSFIINGTHVRLDEKKGYIWSELSLMPIP